jgi:hypothetical protein
MTRRIRDALLGLLALGLMASLIGAEEPQRVSARKSQGQFVLQYMPGSDKNYQNIESVLKKSKIFEDITAMLNADLMLPQTINIIFTNEDGSPFYNPETKEIHLGYGFIFFMSELYKKRDPKAKGQDVIDFSLKITKFTLFHELAHALTDVYHLPVVGVEETAADNLSAVIALNFLKGGEEIALDGAEFFDLLGEYTGAVQESSYWDEHELDPQRYYNMLCMVYGHSPDAVTQALKKQTNEKYSKFIEERGEYCQMLYMKQQQGWFDLLKPHLRNPEQIQQKIPH